MSRCPFTNFHQREIPVMVRIRLAREGGCKVFCEVAVSAVGFLVAFFALGAALEKSNS